MRWRPKSETRKVIAAIIKKLTSTSLNNYNEIIGNLRFCQTNMRCRHIEQSIEVRNGWRSFLWWLLKRLLVKDEMTCRLMLVVLTPMSRDWIKPADQGSHSGWKERKNDWYPLIFIVFDVDGPKTRKYACLIGKLSKGVPDQNYLPSHRLQRIPAQKDFWKFRSEKIAAEVAPDLTITGQKSTLLMMSWKRLEGSKISTFSWDALHDWIQHGNALQGDSARPWTFAPSRCDTSEYRALQCGEKNEERVQEMMMGCYMQVIVRVLKPALFGDDKAAQNEHLLRKDLVHCGQWYTVINEPYSNIAWSGKNTEQRGTSSLCQSKNSC